MSAIRTVLAKFPLLLELARWLRRLVVPRSVSTSYVELGAGEAGAEASRLRGAWQDAVLPHRQRELVERQLVAFRSGEKLDNFEIMRQALTDIGLTVGPVSLLEIGCSSGYYSEVIGSLRPGFVYSGCDYSRAFVAMARKLYPALRFDVEDTTSLGYGDASFDVVVSGCCLLHVPDYAAGVRETARVTGKYAIFHRTPVMVGQREKIYRKLAYGVETVEIHVNEDDFLALLARSGLTIIGTYTLSEMISGGVGSAVRTYACRKVA